VRAIRALLRLGSNPKWRATSVYVIDAESRRFSRREPSGGIGRSPSITATGKCVTDRISRRVPNGSQFSSRRSSLKRDRVTSVSFAWRLSDPSARSGRPLSNACRRCRPCRSCQDAWRNPCTVQHAGETRSRSMSALIGSGGEPSGKSVAMGQWQTHAAHEIFVNYFVGNGEQPIGTARPNNCAVFTTRWRFCLHPLRVLRPGQN
jgi:hypothetical protein